MQKFFIFFATIAKNGKGISLSFLMAVQNKNSSSMKTALILS